MGVRRGPFILDWLKNCSSFLQFLYKSTKIGDLHPVEESVAQKMGQKYHKSLITFSNLPIFSLGNFSPAPYGPAL